MKTTLFLFAALLLWPFWVNSETLYIRSVSARLKTLPMFSAESVHLLKQGDRVDTVRREGDWIYVTSTGNYKGWISSFFTSPQPLIKPGAVTERVKRGVDLTGKGRRRASSYTTSAAARGLYEERARSGDRRYKPDFSSLAVVESYVFSEEEVNDFLKQEGLN